MSGKDQSARFFDAAQEILASEGYGALKLAAVCQRLGVTTGAFYHAFDSWQQFTDAFLATWLHDQTTLLAEVARAHDDPVESLRSLVFAVAAQLQHSAEAAIRAWSNADSRVAEVQARVDADRYAVTHEVMIRLVGPDDAERYAHWGMNVLVGYQLREPDQTSADLEWQATQILDIVAAIYAERSSRPVSAGARGARRAAR